MAVPAIQDLGGSAPAVEDRDTAGDLRRPPAAETAAIPLMPSPSSMAFGGVAADATSLGAAALADANDVRKFW